MFVLLDGPRSTGVLVREPVDFIVETNVKNIILKLYHIDSHDLCKILSRFLKSLADMGECSMNRDGGAATRVLSPPTRLFLQEGEREFSSVEFPPLDFADFSHDLSFAVVSALEDRGISPPAVAIKEVIDNLVHALPCEASVLVYPGLGFVSVSDTGSGIPDISLAMQPGYTTAKAREKRYIRGAGLGFHLAALEMEERGGRLWVESRVGGGTYVRLDILPERLRESVPLEDHRISLRQVGILSLLAEHGPLVVPALASTLGVSVSTAYRDVRDLVRGGLVLRDPSGKIFLSSRGKRYLRSLSGL